jgi:hypothetical protein
MVLHETNSHLARLLQGSLARAKEKPRAVNWPQKQSLHTVRDTMKQALISYVVAPIFAKFEKFEVDVMLPWPTKENPS